MSNSIISISGNLTDDPELRFTPNGTAVCTLRVAVNENYRDAQGKWNDRLLGFFTVNVWRQMAENCGQYLHKGERVTIIGKLQNRSYKDKEDNTKWVTEITATDVGQSLMWAHKEAKGTNDDEDDPSF